jgi:protein-L-isoaspartate(D-aspartate) O-methyltransferase
VSHPTDPGAGADDPRFVAYRRQLIERIRDSGVEDLDVLQLFERVPRHRFLPEGIWFRAYEDEPLPIGFGQTTTQPSLLAYFLAILKPGPGDQVLEIGTGSGFLTALLARAAGRVYSVERVRDLSASAREALDSMGIRNVALMVGDGTIGWRKYAPYQVIVVSAGAPSVPPALVGQLAEDGRMLIPVGDREAQELVLVRKEEGGVSEETIADECIFVPLLGRFGWRGDA